MWRNTGQPVRVLMLDARACFPIVLAACVYWSWTTLEIGRRRDYAFFAAISFFGPNAAGDVPARHAAGWSVAPALPLPSWNRRRYA